MREFVSTHSPVFAINPAVISADNTPLVVDLLGYDGVTLLIAVGVGGITFDPTNKIEFVLTESDDNTTYTNVAAADVVGPASVTNGIVRSLIAAHASPTVIEVGYKGTKRYLKMLADFSGTHGTGTPIAVIANRGFPLTAPVT